MPQATRQRLDDLRHLAAALATAAGLESSRAATFASQLAWYDTAGLPRFGLASLPGWLDRLEGGDLDPTAVGTVVREHASTAVLDGHRGVGPLILARAAGIAGEKAREVGVGLVRVRNLGESGPVAAILAEVALGPMVAMAAGPEGSRGLAIPTGGGLPLVFDSALAAGRPLSSGPWDLLAGDGDWLIQATSVAAIEPLDTLQERVADSSASGEGAGLLVPSDWEVHRREVREKGVPLEAKAWRELKRRAERMGVEIPAKAAR